MPDWPKLVGRRVALWQKIPRREAKGLSQAEELTEACVVAAGLDPLECRPVDAGKLHEAVLREVGPHAGAAHAVANGPAGVDDPLRLF